MNRLGFWFFCCFVSFNSLNAQPGSGAGPYVWNPYDPMHPRQVLEPRYQLFVGQIPSFWTTQQVAEMFLRATGIEVQVMGQMAHGYAFVLTHTPEQRDRLLRLNRRLLAETDGFLTLERDEETEQYYQAFLGDTARQNERQRQGLPRLPIVIEMPRNPDMRTLPHTQ